MLVNINSNERLFYPLILSVYNCGGSCNTSIYDCDCNKASKVDKYLDTKNCSHEKRLIGKLVSECEDEILNKIDENSLVDKKLTYRKNNCLI